MLIIPIPNLLELYARIQPHRPPHGRSRGRTSPRRRAPPSTLKIALIGLVIGVGVSLAVLHELDHPGATAGALKTLTAAPHQAIPHGPIPVGGFRSCAAAHNAGYGHIRRGAEAYSPSLDRDGDGVACEWNTGR